MPSPNGYILSEDVTATTRSWARGALSYDANEAPWIEGQAGNYTFEIMVSTTATGPWVTAQLTSPGDECTLRPNPFSPTGVTSSVFGVGGPNIPRPPLADTDYWARIILRGPATPGGPTDTVLEDYVVGPYHSMAYPATLCAVPSVTTDSATVGLLVSSGRLNVTAPCDADDIVWEVATSASGPWTAAPSEPVEDFSPEHTFTGLAANTTYFYRARLSEQPGIGSAAGGEYLVTEPCSFTTLEAVVTTPSFNPQPCCDGAGGGADFENVVLCDLDAEGNLLGTAIAVYEEGALPGQAPIFVDPITGAPYVVQGTLQVCPEGTCLPPMQFCQTGTSTGPVEHPGRQYDLTLPINPGFAVQSMQVGQVSNAAGIVWEVDDPDGERFRADLTAFMESRLPAAATVTITNPNAGTTVCGTAAAMQVHIECLRLDQSPPDLIELVYNAGQDMVINPAYNETPPLNPPVAQGNYGFHLLSRQDDPGPFPGNPPANDADCTSVANRGWETNDVGRTFEIWGQNVAVGVTPTPRGTPVQEITSDGPPPGGRSTIWQTFQAPASGNFIIRVVHGARDAGENHIITLDNGDTDDAQNGTLINNVTNNVGVVTGGNNIPWTTFNQTIPLVGGSTYTLALSTNNPAGGARGGLFTDMRAYLDIPDQRATATTDDETCVVVTEETTTTTTCSFWQPQCVGGVIAGWQKVDTGDTLTNAEFWAQVPTPGCCLPESSSGGESSATLSNMLTSDVVCVTNGGIQQSAIRVIVTDPSGGTIQEQFIGTDGAPVQPETWTAGSCTDSSYLTEEILCDVQPDGSVVSFRRVYTHSVLPGGAIQNTNHQDFDLNSPQVYVTTGTVRACDATEPVGWESICYTLTGTGPLVHPGTKRHDDSLPAPGFAVFDVNGVLVDTSADGYQQVPCDSRYDTETQVLCDQGAGGQQFLRKYTVGEVGQLVVAQDTELDGTTPYVVVGPVDSCAQDTFSTTGLCTPDGTPLAIVTRFDGGSGTYVDDGWINLLTGLFTAGNPPVGTVACGDARSIQVSGTFCSVDDTTGDVLALVLVEYTYNPDGSIASTRLVNAVDGTTYTVPAGATITTCPTGEAPPDADLVVLCDDNGSFLRDFRRDESNTVVGVTNYTLAGAPYVPVGAVGTCAGRDQEVLVLCDSAATPNRFLRRYNYNLSTGALVSIVNTTLDGSTPFSPTGAVGVCATTTQTEFDVDQVVLCDSNGTSFIRRFTFNTSTGAVTATTNLTLAGGAFTPVGTVSLCSNCCPVVVAEGCTNTGSGRYVATRATNGTITLQDAITGAAITQANIVQCVQQVAPTSVTLNAQGRLIADVDAAWTPGTDVTGTLTSVTFTVLSGTANVVDSNGTAMNGLPAGYSATWEAEDHGTLTGPQSIDAIGGQTAVVWTQK